MFSSSGRMNCVYPYDKLKLAYNFTQLAWVNLKKRRKNAGDFKCTMPPAFCNSTRPQHTLQMFADHCGPRQIIPLETINQGLLQPQGELYPIQTILNHCSQDQLLEFCTSFNETISRGFLVQENFKHTQFSREHWYWRDSQLGTSRTQSERLLSELLSPSAECE